MKSNKGVIGNPNIRDFKKRLKKYISTPVLGSLTNAPQFGSEVTFIDIEIERIQDEIKTQRDNIKKGTSTVEKMNKEYWQYYNTLLELNTKYLEWLEDRKSVLNVNAVRSFKSDLNTKQLEKLYYLLTDKFISPDTSPEAFTLIFSGGCISSKNKIIWKLLTQRYEPHKLALRELLEFILTGPVPMANVPTFFTDNNNDPMSINKPKKGEFSNYYTELEDIIN